jgi:hypothetical protein
VVLSENGAPKIHWIHVLVIIVPIRGYALFSDTSHIGAEHKLSDAQKQFYVFFFRLFSFEQSRKTNPFTSFSLDWFKGKSSPETMGLSHQIIFGQISWLVLYLTFSSLYSFAAC